LKKPLLLAYIRTGVEKEHFSFCCCRFLKNLILA
jgi:hypothetical protein